MALTQRSFARESVGFTLADDWTTSKSEKVSVRSLLNISSLSEAVSVSDPNVDVSGLLGRRRLQQKKLI